MGAAVEKTECKVERAQPGVQRGHRDIGSTKSPELHIPYSATSSSFFANPLSKERASRAGSF